MTAAAPGGTSAAAPAPARTVAVALLLSGLGVATIVTLLGLTTFGRPGSYEFTPFGDVAAFVFEATLLSLGFVLRSRRPANSIGWLFLALGICATLSHLAWATMQLVYLPGGDARLGAIASWLGSVGSILTWTYLITSIVIRFPDGRPATDGEARLLRWLPLFVRGDDLADGDHDLSRVRCPHRARRQGDPRGHIRALRRVAVGHADRGLPGDRHPSPV